MSEYIIKLLYYGRCTLKSTPRPIMKEEGQEWTDSKDIEVKASSSNIRIVPFSPASSEDFPEVAIYEMVKQDDSTR